MTYLEKLARAFNPAAADALTYESQLRFLDQLEQTNPEKFQKIMSNNSSLREGLESWRQMGAKFNPPTPVAPEVVPPVAAAPSPPPPTPPPSNPAASMGAAPEPVPHHAAPRNSTTGVKLSGGLGALFAPFTAGMTARNLSDADYAQAGLNAAWTGEAALGAARSFTPKVLPSALQAPVTGTAATGALGGTASLGAGLASAPIVGSWMYDIAHSADALREGGANQYLQSSDDYMGDNNWKTIPKAVFSPLTAGAALINRGTQVIEQNAANQAQADAVAMQEGRLDRLQAMDQEFASKGGFKTPDEMYANMYGYNDVNAYQQALRSGEFKPEQTMGEARAMLQRGTVRPVYGALAPQNNTPYTANVGNPQLPETPAIAPAPKPGAAPAVPAPGEPVQSKNNPPAPRLNPELRPVAEAAKPQPRVSPQLQQPTAAAQPQTDPAANQQQWEKRFLTETGTKYNPVSRADRASMQRMMGGDQTYNIQQWRSAGRPDAQPDFSVAYNSKPLRPNTQVAKKIAPTPVKTGELVRRNTGVTTADGELWANPADKDYLIKDARYSDLTWEEYTKLPPSKKAENIDTFFNTAEKTI